MDSTAAGCSIWTSAGLSVLFAAEVVGLLVRVQLSLFVFEFVGFSFLSHPLKKAYEHDVHTLFIVIIKSLLTLLG